MELHVTLIKLFFTRHVSVHLGILIRDFVVIAELSMNVMQSAQQM
jgi:hypothetical protein